MSVAGDLMIKDGVVIPEWELQESFIRASGPGGQNVNKTSSAVQLRWNVRASSIPAPIKSRFERRYRARLTNEGDILVEAKEHRSQTLNREAARRRLADMVRGIAEPPKRRIKTKPTAGAVRRRLKTKKQRGEVKALRGKVTGED